MDGTFYIAPKLFHQLYTLHVLYNGMMVPCIYALMPNRLVETYVKLFRFVPDCSYSIGMCFNPQTFQIDFVRAAMKAINLVFPNANIKGCLFHFSQCIWRRVQKFGLQKEYDNADNENDIAKTVKRLCALPLIRPEEIDDAFEIIVGGAPDDPRVDKLLEYFFNNFFKESEKFSRVIWNHWETSGLRTTNHLEGWHFGFNRSVGISHPNLWQFIQKIKEEQIKYDLKITQLQKGRKVTKSNRKYTRIQARLRRMTSIYLSGGLTLREFIDCVKFIEF